MARTLLPLAGMAGVLLLCAWLVAGLTGMMLAFAGLVLLALAAPAMPTHMVMRIHGASSLHPVQAPRLYRLVAKLTRRADLDTVPQLYRIRSIAPSAFTVSGHDEDAIAVSDGLLRVLDNRELAGVLAHEIAHIASGDVILMRLGDLMRQLTSFICNLGLLALLIAALFAPGGAIPLSAVLLLAAAPIGLGLLQLALSRGREFAADAEAARMTHDPLALASALQKLETVNRWTLRRLAGQFSGFEVPSCLRTHPATEERIARLAQLHRDLAPRPALSTDPFGPWRHTS